LELAFALPFLVLGWLGLTLESKSFPSGVPFFEFSFPCGVSVSEEKWSAIEKREQRPMAKMLLASPQSLRPATSPQPLRLGAEGALLSRHNLPSSKAELCPQRGQAALGSVGDREHVRWWRRELLFSSMEDMAAACGSTASLSSQVFLCFSFVVDLLDFATLTYTVFSFVANSSLTFLFWGAVAADVL
jgi:hypothetical protein